jgi:hypothetical protein
MQERERKLGARKYESKKLEARERNDKRGKFKVKQERKIASAKGPAREREPKGTKNQVPCSGNK